MAICPAGAAGVQIFALWDLATVENNSINPTDSVSMYLHQLQRLQCSVESMAATSAAITWNQKSNRHLLACLTLLRQMDSKLKAQRKVLAAKAKAEPKSVSDKKGSQKKNGKTAEKLQMPKLVAGEILCFTEDRLAVWFAVFQV